MFLSSRNLIQKFTHLRIFSTTPILSQKVPISLKESDLEEKFVLGSGKGGQKVNKTSSCVQLKHLPTGILIETQRFREREKNRKEARKLLILKLDLMINGPESKISKKVEKLKKKKKRAQSRAQAKYQGDVAPIDSRGDKSELSDGSAIESTTNDTTGHSTIDSNARKG
jgi:protein subunit release factor B